MVSREKEKSQKIGVLRQGLGYSGDSAAKVLTKFCTRVYGAECIGHEFNLAEGENTSSTIKKHP